MSQYRVEGMTCGGCAASLEKAIRAIAPNAKVEVNLENQLVRVSGFDDAAAIGQAVEDAGFDFGGEV